MKKKLSILDLDKFLNYLKVIYGKLNSPLFTYFGKFTNSVFEFNSHFV
ncbi:MAG: hypothetical protein RLZZ185_511 [Bacteroidota bacterium]|jgi:hypothetical protein